MASSRHSVVDPRLAFIHHAGVVWRRHLNEDLAKDSEGPIVSPGLGDIIPNTG